MALLEVEDLEVYYDSEDGPVKAVDGVSFEIEAGETVGIVGESGCGKSTLAKALIGILPKNGYINGGKILFKGEDLTDMPEKRRRELRWDEISLIAQSAMNALDPVYTIREQILEAIDAHYPKMGRTEAQEIIDESFDIVGLDRERQTDYPHQFSGGMRQRAMIAMSLVLQPSLILADEPTTALDVIMQDQILKRINGIQRESDTAMMVITHDVAVVAETCDRVVVMYAGELAEEGPAEFIFGEPYHPYTLGLKSAFPDIRLSEQDLVSIGGHPPDLSNPPSGCRFAERCPLATEICTQQDPPMVEHGELRSFCHHTDRIDSELRSVASSARTWQNDASMEVGDD
ncbi:MULTISPECIES: ABC transporter ATP-binding protein [unclassified Haladaptatus]|uniref:ABC transporter ATP-binding protein n=1 Tax=unclassified Haladaptatus TaxID=2622732 RepID=UPI00209BDD81|nr:MULTISPECIES: ABC transporter ATP-binding protein [unclassified Haladaptatus]MCO8246449.1 ABC transporter ATP-binding protein [Haladaptatus sp. AB643]MCO8254686.1 ABC transporter ATP-binding protein [Haladaptatus sp. AB618]